MKILFQGDSITDGGRLEDKENNIGYGYVKYTTELIKERFQNIDFDFINLGINGNRVESLLQRLETDFISINPDIISIMIGVNDTLHHTATKIYMKNQEFEDIYRNLLTQLKARTNSKIIVLEPFLLCSPANQEYYEDLFPKILVVRALAREFADAYIPLDGIFAAATVDHEASFWSADGIHPTEEGAKLIASQYLNAIAKLIEV